MKTKALTQNWRNFIQLCLAAKTEKELSELFDLMLTNAEKDDLAVRYAIIKELLVSKKTQRELAKTIEISIAKVTRGSNALKIAKPATKAWWLDKI